MNSKEINSLISDTNFLGCFASNDLPKKVEINELLIENGANKNS